MTSCLSQYLTFHPLFKPLRGLNIFDSSRIMETKGQYFNILRFFQRKTVEVSTNVSNMRHCLPLLHGYIVAPLGAIHK